MGCDIHMYLEYGSKERHQQALDGKENGRGEKITMYWQGLGGRMSMGRNYSMFGILSQGVRSDFDNGSPAKGLPTDGMSWETEDDAYIRIDNELAKNDYEGHYCTLAQAEGWAKYGEKIHYRTDADGNEIPWRVDHPDWHSHSWLTTEEYEAALQEYEKLAGSDEYWGVPATYKAVLAAMKSFESDGQIARVIFWFDN